MARIPQNVIIIHIGSHATIPSDYDRETTLDSKFAKICGDTVAPNNTGGAATHTHTSSSHTHSLGNHTHTYTTSSVDWGVNKADVGSNSDQSFNGSHYHTGTSGASSGGDISGTVTYGARSNEPPYRKVIFIKAKSGGANLFTNATMFYESNTPPSNWSNVTELQGRYLKGAATGADADLSTDNGSSTNLHDITHTHSTATHTHAEATSSGPSSVNRKQGNGGGSYATQFEHRHTISLSAGTQALNTNSDTLTTAETVEPAYKLIQTIKMGASGKKEKLLCGLWLGATAAIPKGWSLITTYKDKHIKIGDPAGATGGSNAHTHAAQAHSHTSNGTHTHSGTGGNHGATIAKDGSGQDAFSANSNSHTITSDAGTGTYASANTTADSSSNEPEYRTVALIRFEKEMSGGGMLLQQM